MASFKHSLVLAVVALLATAASSRHLSQGISFSGSGCGDIPPGPPANLKATPGDGQVELKWQAPSNGACVDQYMVIATPVGSPSPRLGGGQAPSTKSYEYTVKGLQNGQEYEFTVIASANKYSNNAASSTVRATPKSPSPPPSPVFQLCSQYIYPNGPANLRTTSVGKTEVGLCWDPPSSNGCVDSYDLKIEPVDPGMLRTTASAPIRVQSTRCYTVKDLSPGTKYRATVTSYNKTYNGGGSSSIEFTTNAA